VTDTQPFPLIEQFLLANGWVPDETSVRYRRFRPPGELGLEEGFALALPAQVATPGAGELLGRIVSVLSSVHDVSDEQLRIVLAVPDTVLSVRVVNQHTSHGAIPLPMFESLVDRLKRTLRHAAAFTVSDAPLLEDGDPEEAQEYLSRCQFLQTERGSFVAKVQLPSLLELTEPSFFKPTPVTEADVNVRLQNVVDFAVNRVLLSPPEDLLSDNMLTQYSHVLSVDLLEDLAGIFARPEMGDVSMRFLSAQSSSAFRPSRISDKRLKLLHDFTSFARSRFAALIPIDFRGKIVELRSRNPSGNRNHVLLAGVLEGRQTYLAVSLGRSDYWYANQAHTAGQLIRVAGYARQMKTQLKLVDRELFQVLDEYDPSREGQV
jgi:hypothetical protein